MEDVAFGMAVPPALATVDHREHHSKDAPVFVGNPHRLHEYLRRIIAYSIMLNENDQYLAGPQLYLQLTGAAWCSTAGVIVPDRVKAADDATLLLDRRERTFGKLRDTTLFAARDRFFFWSTPAGADYQPPQRARV